MELEEMKSIWDDMSQEIDKKKRSTAISEIDSKCKECSQMMKI